MKVFCHNCGRRTNHSIVGKGSVLSEPSEEYRWGEKHFCVQCAGGEDFNYAIEEWEEGARDPDTDEYLTWWRTYPRNETERKPIENWLKCPPKIRVIYGEVVGAMNAKLPVLTAIGLRALIEALCRENNATGSNLEKSIDSMAAKGILSKAQADILHTHRFLGNVAAHEITSAKTSELVAALEIAETMLKTLYVLPVLSGQIKTGRKP